MGSYRKDKLMGSKTNNRENELVDEITALGGCDAVTAVTTNYSERHNAYLTIVALSEIWGGGSANGTGVSKEQSLSNALLATKALLGSRRPPVA